MAENRNAQQVREITDKPVVGIAEASIKMAAAMGVPNTAENAALMPLIMRIFRSPSCRCSSLPNVFPRLPPI